MNPHLDQPIVFKGQPITPHNPVILAFHGRSQTTDVVVDVFDRLQWNEASLVAPTAAENSWYPGRFMEPLENNEPYLTYALERITHLMDMLREQGVPKTNLNLLGFSQGACLVAEYAVRHAERYGGLMIFTGGVIGPEGTRWDYGGSLNDTPTLITACDTDAWVPVGRVKETSHLLRQKGASVTEKIFAAREHLVCDEEIDLARQVFINQ